MSTLEPSLCRRKSSNQFRIQKADFFFFPLNRKNFLQLILTAVMFCEFLIYYLVIFQYSWPEVQMPFFAKYMFPDPLLKWIIFGHLLGEIKGHEVDGLLRN